MEISPETFSAWAEEISARHDRAGLSGGGTGRLASSSPQKRLGPLPHFQAGDQRRSRRAGGAVDRRAIRRALARNDRPPPDQGPLRRAVEETHGRDRYLPWASSRAGGGRGGVRRSKELRGFRAAGLAGAGRYRQAEVQ